ncbi:uncharacterized protein LOC108680513 [Hyalella azteca]|uniref:Uncharacterized protein LOC108680513 n=1 Tax=Hyalella azteca TaxID=294128 RepID=A0A8B7PFC7_HYAAZ|nr:uncharacterized protein LOC108680513 [Hyalella azteca]
MSYYDGMEAVFLRHGSFTPTFARERSARSTNFSAIHFRISHLQKFIGQLQVWLVLILLVSPTFTKPIKPISLYIPRPRPTSYPTKDPTKEQPSSSKSSSSNSILHQLMPEPQFPALEYHNLHYRSVEPSLSPRGIESNFLVKPFKLPVIVSTTSSNINDNDNSKVQLIDESSQQNSIENILFSDLSSQSSASKDDSSSVRSLNKLSDNVPSAPTSKFRESSPHSLEDSNNILYNKNIKPTLVTRAFLIPSSKKDTSSNLRSFHQPSPSPSSSTKDSSTTLVEALTREEDQFKSLLDSFLGVSSNTIDIEGSASPSFRRTVTQVVSRVPRHTEPATRLEDPTLGADTRTALKPARSSRMDSPDNVARNGRVSSSSSSGSSGGRTAHWSSPCRIVTEVNPNSSPAYFSENIYHSINVAHKHAHRFKETFASQLWLGLSWEEALSSVRDEPYEFLNRLSHPSEDELQALEFKSALAIAYESMQRRAVAIEQVTLDQALYRDLNDTDFLSEFRSIEGEIVSILCELHYAMKQLQVAPAQEITAEIMDEKYRDLDVSSDRLERDTIILREYISGLDYLVRVFDHFRSQSS